MQTITKGAFFAIGLTLFSMFFGAGNFIFPPFVGHQAGDHTAVAIIAFCITAVFFPMLGIAAVARSNGIHNLASRVHPRFAVVYIVALMLIIGPLFAIPRAANMPYELAILPFLGGGDGAVSPAYLAIYSVIYFIINYLLCRNPNTIVTTLGKILTPILLLLIVLIFLFAMTTPMPVSGDLAAVAGSGYDTSPFLKGVTEGYQTMDALASVVFGLVILTNFRAIGVTDRQTIISSTIKAGIMAGIILAFIYMMLAVVGTGSRGIIAEPENGAKILVAVTHHLFGRYGNAVMGISVGLACLTTTVGLLCSISEYFATISRVSYRTWLVLWCVVSSLIANLGLTLIIKHAVPFLFVIYPVTLVFIALSLINQALKSDRAIYTATIAVTLFVSLVHTFSVPALSPLFARILPFYEAGLGWILPALLALGISYAVRRPALAGVECPDDFGDLA